MTLLTAAEIARRSGGRVEGDPDARVDAWAFDSRALQAGACFVALRDQRDGHDFVRAAFDAGAHIAVVDHRPGDVQPPASGRALVHVDDTLTALQAVARSLRIERDDLHVVAVAGSTGKTSTKDLLAAALTPCGVHANAASYNNEFGLPITLCNTPDAAKVVVTEMGERQAGDLALLCDIAQPQHAVVTNVGLAHAEYLGGPEGVVEVLAELLDALPAAGTAVLSADDPWTALLESRTHAQVVTVGEHDGAAYRVTDIALDPHARPSFSLRGVRLSVPLHGAHHVQNAALAAVAAHHAFGLSFEEIAIELAGVSSGRWRMELTETDDGVTVLNDAYNANPTSMDAALVALTHLTASGRRIAVLGEMRELGVHHDDAHRRIGERIAELAIDVLVGVGIGGARIAQAAAAAGVETEVVDDAAAALAWADAHVAAGDVVLCKASRAVGLEAVAEGLLARRKRVGAS